MEPQYREALDVIAYFDCFSGVAGDMICAALIDAGADLRELRNSLRQLNLPEFEVEIEAVRRGGLAARRFLVKTTPSSAHRSLRDILELIRRAGLSDAVKRNAARIFERLGQAEAKVHGTGVDHVHFHEVGAVDSIVDIVGSCICLELLKIEEIFFPAVPVGSGTIRDAEGMLPVPAPATAELLKEYKIYSGGEGELTTPTGAAILTSLGRQVPFLPDLTIKSIGYGAGSRDDPGRPNVLRVIVGQTCYADQAEVDQVCLLACQLDDMSGQELGFLAERLWDAGALDVVYVPIYMKKARPAVKLEALAGPADADRLAEVILRHSSSFGLRRTLVTRQKLKREFFRVTLPAGEVNVKIGYLAGKVVRLSPEYEDCRKLALQTETTLKEVYRQACEEAQRILNDRTAQD